MTPTRTLLVTGGGIGIGRATALAFARAQWHVVVTDILEAEGRAVAAQISAAGGSASFAALDVRSTEQAEAVVAAVLVMLSGATFALFAPETYKPKAKASPTS